MNTDYQQPNGTRVTDHIHASVGVGRQCRMIEQQMLTAAERMDADAINALLTSGV